MPLLQFRRSSPTTRSLPLSISNALKPLCRRQLKSSLKRSTSVRQDRSRSWKTWGLAMGAYLRRNPQHEPAIIGELQNMLDGLLANEKESDQ